ncbi:hypothetical protein HPB51_027002 [Rhipicephalus microplus]|uniref:Uncharacterized protein n=2 Tax=Rhipicephalus microplus TaxID=6941 RepID=A0A9J6D1J1_RHIMP|nr:hypothetical protein HPB51_027002 [Rhipicephalus microplus]
MRRRELVGGVLLAAASFLLPNARASPRCENTSRGMHASYTCIGFTSTQQFADQVERPLPSPITFVLTDCELPELPAFNDIAVHVLELSNVTVRSFGSDDALILVAGVDETLEKIVFRDHSSLPASWSLLNNLKMLKVLRLFNMAALNLTTDYNALAASLTVVEVVQSSIAHIDEDWLARVTGLESLVIRDCNLKHFRRSMLPRPAPNLWNLDLVGNNLTSLPEDFGEDYPALKFLDLGSNSLATVTKAGLAPLLDAPIEAIELGGNPLMCNCSVEHLRAFPVELLSAVCWAPEALWRRKVQELTDEDLQCSS